MVLITKNRIKYANFEKIGSRPLDSVIKLDGPLLISRLNGVRDICLELREQKTKKFDQTNLFLNETAINNMIAKIGLLRNNLTNLNLTLEILSNELCSALE